MSKRILVIEDTEDNRRILRDLLTNAGFDVIEATDGEKGVALPPRRSTRPHPDGYPASGDRRLRGDPPDQGRRRISSKIPIIAVTSYALSGDEAKTRAAGCDGYIAKPFSPRQILAMVRDFLALSAERAGG